MKWNFYNKFCKYLLLSQAIGAYFSKTRYLIIYFLLLVAGIVWWFINRTWVTMQCGTVAVWHCGNVILVHNGNITAISQINPYLAITWGHITLYSAVATDRGEHETQFIQNTGTLPEGPDSRIHTLYIKSLILRSNYNGLYLVKKTNCKRFWITFKHWIKRNINFKHWSSGIKLGFVGVVMVKYDFFRNLMIN